LGFGLEGRDLSQFLLKQKAKITVFDQKEAKNLDKEFEEFKKQGVKFKLGQDYLKEGLTDYNFVFRSPGFSPLRPEIIEAQKRGVVISSATKLFFEFCPGKIIGVTGTKGKGTTATLIYEILKKDGQKVFLAGNIGQPMLALLPKIKKGDWIVLELSSFQLQDLEKSPHIAVVLFIVPEHLNYHQDTKEYIRAKSNIVNHQSKYDLAVLNTDDLTSSSFASLTPAQIYCFSRRKEVNGAYVQRGEIYLAGQKVGPVKDLKIRGVHNWDNVCASVLTAHLAGARLESIRKAVFAFQGLEHRLEKVAVIKEVAFYNDSFSTTPETTIAAIKSFKKPLVLIAGGSEKGSDYHDLGKKIAQSSVKTLILIGQMADKIKQAVLEAGFQGEIIFRPSEKMSEIVKLAFQKAQPSGIVLLSPACASFDLFLSYKDRGLQFKKYVKAL
ncbi:MAG: UDP-N-acetylmuramoyl-L-alanine--D-glutamate ligase, partial [Candidatus Shapirobacteria bacterium]|nr:UDP-N-acetylmuramoyl-L-alanine--D-glutamate ligase [Candidatus Shapirobacteria bacterium]